MIRLKRPRLLVPTLFEQEEYTTGSFCKVGNGRELFWVQLIEIQEDHVLTGIVMNPLLSTNAYPLGTLIELHARNIVEVQTELELQRKKQLLLERVARLEQSRA